MRNWLAKKAEAWGAAGLGAERVGFGDRGGRHDSASLAGGRVWIKLKFSMGR